LAAATAVETVVALAGVTAVETVAALAAVIVAALEVVAVALAGVTAVETVVALVATVETFALPGARPSQMRQAAPMGAPPSARAAVMCGSE